MSTPRSQAVDLFKLAAAFGVVIIHQAPSTPAAEFLTLPFQLVCVPFFLLISLYFFIRKASRPSCSFSELRLDRILVPYIAWTAIYTLMRWVKFSVRGQAFSLDGVGVIFFGGGAVQLYFLPLLLLFQAMALALIFLLREPRRGVTGIVVALGAIGFGYAGSSGAYFGFQSALKSGCIYVAMAFLLDRTQAWPMGKKINLVAGCLAGGIFFFTLILGHPPIEMGILYGPVLAYGAAALALNWHFYIAFLPLRLLLTCSYGIYLAHFGFLETFEFLAEKIGHPLAPYSLLEKMGMGSLICGCCVVMICAARRHWLPAYLLFGELREDRGALRK